MCRWNSAQDGFLPFFKRCLQISARSSGVNLACFFRSMLDWGVLGCGVLDLAVLDLAVLDLAVLDLGVLGCGVLG